MPDDRNMREQLRDAFDGVPLTHGYDIRRMLRAEEREAIIDAILDELREPDEAMWQAAREGNCAAGWLTDWQLLIDAAKQERG